MGLAQPGMFFRPRLMLPMVSACALSIACGALHALPRGESDGLGLKISMALQAIPQAVQAARTMGIAPGAPCPRLAQPADEVSVPAATLRQVVENARMNNPDAARAEAQIRKARADVEAAGSAYLPQLRISASGGAAARNGLASAANAQLSKLLHDFGKTDSLIEEARMREEARLHERLETLDRLTLEVVETWINVSRQSELARLHAEAAAGLEEAVRIVRLRADAGLAGTGDVELAQARLAQTRAAGLAACSQREQSLSRLSTLAGTRIDDTVPSVPVALLREGPDTHWDASMRPSVRQAQAEHAAALHHVASIRASRWPSLHVQATRGVSGGKGQNDTPSAVNLLLSMDVLEAGTESRIESASAEAAAALTRVQAARDAAEDTLRRTHAELRGIETRRPLLVSQATSTSATRRNFLDQFLAGRRQVLDLLNTHQEVLAADLALSSLQFDRMVLVARLHGLYGDLDDVITQTPAGLEVARGANR